MPERAWGRGGRVGSGGAPRLADSVFFGPHTRKPSRPPVAPGGGGQDGGGGVFTGGL